MNPQVPIKLVAAAVCVVIALLIAPQVMETVENGTYQVRQWPVTGQIDVKMDPGMWFQCFGSISVWPKAETFYFTADTEGDIGKHEDASIEVTFNDGSKCKISGTCRIEMPKTSDQAKSLINQGMRTHNDVEEKLIKPVLRNALVLTANMMTARESYSEKRIDFWMMAWDQIQHGMYEVEETSVDTKDPITGQIVNRKLKTPMKDKNGKVMRQPQSNIFEGTGITLSNFEIKQYIYEKVVQEQIGEQQKATMAVVTAMANAKKADQDRLRNEAEGKAAVTKAQYEKEQEKIRAVTDALKEKEVAVTKAEQEKSVASLAKDAADFTKQKDILLGEGEAKRKELVMAADGALEKKLAAWVDAQKAWAEAFSKRNVPGIVMGGNGTGGDSQAHDFMSLLTAKAAQDLALNLEMVGKASRSPAVESKK